MRRQMFVKMAYVVAAAIVLSAAGWVAAQETTGSIRGLVADEFGTPMAGAVVTATGPSGTVTATSGSDGTFRFPRLGPGGYEVATTFEGYQPSKAEVSVALGEASTVNFGLQQAFSDEITVYSDTVAIDFTESQTELSVREWEIE